MKTKIDFSKLKTERGAGSVLQICLLVFGVFAFAYLISAEFRVVSAIPDDCGKGFTNGGQKYHPGKCLNKDEDRYNAISSGQSCGVGRYYVKNHCGSGWDICCASPVKVQNTQAGATTPTTTTAPIGNPLDDTLRKWGMDYFKSTLFSSLGSKENEAQDSSGDSGIEERQNKVDAPNSDEKDSEEDSDEEKDSSEKSYSDKLGGAKAIAGTLFKNLGYSIAIYGVIRLLGPIVGLTDNEASATAAALSTGFFAASTTYQFVSASQLGSAGVWGATIGAGIVTAAIVFYATYRDYKYETVQVDCKPWQPQTGGDNCGLCNNQPGGVPCTEYQCKSLGQACELENKGTNEEICVWIEPNDAAYPIIEPWDDALASDDYEYTPDGAISPPDRGVIIEYQDSRDNCIPPFTPFSFGITTDEPSQCKIDYKQQRGFENMSYYFGGKNTYAYNHTQTMALPGPDSLKSQNITLENGGEFQVYVKCQDANGNSNTANFVFRYCVDDSPDTTPPLVQRTNPVNEAPIRYNQSTLETSIYLNEPAECKWSHLNQNYEEMTEKFECVLNPIQMSADMLYECKTTLNGIKDKKENTFYFRCIDKPGAEEGDRNQMSQPYIYKIMGTQPLVIDSAEPNGTTVKDSTESVKVTLEVETNAGYKEGDSTCSYSTTGEEDDYVAFLYPEGSSSHTHAQDLWLVEGDYEYYIKCTDLGGNTDTTQIQFTIDSDSEAPEVVRAYNEGEYLKIITNENATCVYDTNNCNYLFEDGLPMTAFGETGHYTDWETNKNFYIKCQDSFGSQPLPDECSIVVRPLQY